MDDKFFLSMVEKFNSAGIGELEFTDGNTRLVLRKENSCAAPRQGPETSAGKVAEAPVKEAAQNHSVNPGPANTASETSGGGEKIKSPIVATFYSSPGPDAPPFVKPGSKIKTGQTLCILEAMKMMNHLEAEFDCEIIEVHAASGDLVEYGQEIFTVKRT